MRTSFLSVVLLSGAMSALGQGTVYFNNRVPNEVVAPIFGPAPLALTLSLQGNPPSTGSPLTDAYPAGTTDYMGAPGLSGTDYTAELWSLVGGLWTAVPNTQRSFRTGAAAGFVQIPLTGADVTIPSTPPGSTATLEVRAWASHFGTPDPVDDWTEALARNVIRGQSAPFDETLGGSVGGGPAFPTPNMDNFRSFNIRSVPAPSSSDFNADGRTDIVLQNVDGSVGFWLMNGTTITQGLVPYVVLTTWRIAGTADFNADSNTDIVLQNSDGSVGFWLMNGTTVTQGLVPYTLPAGWQIVGTGEFNADGQTDIVLQNVDGSVAFWLMNGTTVTQGLVPYTLPVGWQIVGTGDFNADGQTDIVLQSVDGWVAFWLMNGTTVTQGLVLYTLPAGWQIVGTGDFSADGQTDIVLQNVDGSVAFWLMNGTAIAQGLVPYTVPAGWRIVGPR